MTTFVSLSKPSRFTQYARPLWADQVNPHVLHSKWGVEVHPAGNCRIELLSGKAAAGADGSGQEVEELKPTQRGLIRIGTIRPTKYQVLVVTNPALQEAATVQAPQLLEPGEECKLDIYLHAHRTLRMSDVQWLVRLYLVE